MSTKIKHSIHFIVILEILHAKKFIPNSPKFIMNQNKSKKIKKINKNKKVSLSNKKPIIFIWKGEISKIPANNINFLRVQSLK